MEATVLKPRAIEFLHKVYMCSVFFDLEMYPIEQAKQIQIDPLIFVSRAGRPKAYPDE